MGIHCVAFGCKNRQGDGQDLRFHRFPLSRPDVLCKWILAVRRDQWFPTRFSRLCSAHFAEDDYSIKSGVRTRLLNNDAVPSIFVYTSNSQEKTEETHSDTSHQVTETPFVTWVYPATEDKSVLPDVDENLSDPYATNGHHSSVVSVKTEPEEQ